MKQKEIWIYFNYGETVETADYKEYWSYENDVWHHLGNWFNVKCASYKGRLYAEGFYKATHNSYKEHLSYRSDRMHLITDQDEINELFLNLI